MADAAVVVRPGDGGRAAGAVGSEAGASLLLWPASGSRERRTRAWGKRYPGPRPPPAASSSQQPAASRPPPAARECSATSNIIRLSPATLFRGGAAHARHARRPKVAGAAPTARPSCPSGPGDAAAGHAPATMAACSEPGSHHQ